MIEIFKALADETRLRILSQLLKDEMCVCEIEDCLELTQSNASRHLTVLKKAGILESYKKAQWTYYNISDEFKSKNMELYKYLIKMISGLSCYERDSQRFKKCKANDLCNNN